MYQNSLEIIGAPNASLAAPKKANAEKKQSRLKLRRFALLDEHPLRGECLACWLRETNAGSIVSMFQKIDALLNYLETDRDFNLVFFSTCETPLPQVLDALDMFRSLSPSIPAIVISSEEDPAAALECLRHGARGFIPISLDITSASKALDFVVGGGTYLPAPLFLETCSSGVQRYRANGVSAIRPEEDQQGQEPGPLCVTPATATVPTEPVGLTVREAKVLMCLCRGKQNKLIAHELGLSESTVKMYVGRLMRKIRATNRTELALFGAKLLRDGESS